MEVVEGEMRNGNMAAGGWEWGWAIWEWGWATWRHETLTIMVLLVSILFYHTIVDILQPLYACSISTRYLF